MTMEQPDGSQVDVRLFGDEFYARGESLDGYTVMRDPRTGAICYAALNGDSTEWVSTGMVYHGGSLAPSSPSLAGSALGGIDPGQDLKREARHRIRSRAIRELGLEAGDAGQIDGSDRLKPLGKIASSSARSAASAGDSILKVTGVIVLVDFPDVPATIPKEQIGDMANLNGFKVNGNNGSIRDYFLDVSHGKFEYNLEVTDYYTARYTKDYYDRDDGYAGALELIKETLQALHEKGYDFSKLSLSSTGRVRSVNVLFAGSAGKVWAQGLWAHRGNIPTLTFDGVRLSGYMLAYIGSALTIGTFVHESGHLIFGWPDLYDYDSDSRGIGSYCLMSGQHAKNPQPPNAYLRADAGWEPILDLKAGANGSVPVASNGRATYVYGNPRYLQEAYVIENVAKKGRWANMPDEGLMVWHVDENGDNSLQDRTPSRHYSVSVVQADGKFDLESNVNGGGANDLFHLGNNDALTAQTVPDSRWWDGSESGLSLIHISAVQDTMTFQIEGGMVGLAGKPGDSGTSRIRRRQAKAGYAWRLDGRRVWVPTAAGAKPAPEFSLWR